MVKFLSALFITALCLFVVNGIDFHDCEDGADHGPDCNSCLCVFCATGFVGADISTYDFDFKFDLSQPFSSRKVCIKFGDIVIELDQPPRA